MIMIVDWSSKFRVAKNILMSSSPFMNCIKYFTSCLRLEFITIKATTDGEIL